MYRRQVIAVLALLGCLDSVYLLLHRLGYVGSLACVAGGGCDVVNASRYAIFMGFPVAGYGVAGYLVILAIAIAGVQPRRLNQRRPDQWIAALAAVGSASSLYLTYIALAVIGTACPWCLLSLAIILGILGLSVAGLYAGRRVAVRAD